MKDEVKRSKKAREDYEALIAKYDIEREELNDTLEDQRQQIMEFKNESKLRAEHIQADKRTIEMLEARIKEIETPAHYLREQVNMSELKATRHKADASDAKLKLTTYQEMVYQFEKENKSLKQDNEHLKEMNDLYKNRMTSATVKLETVTQEFNVNKGNFDNVNNIISVKDEKITTLTKNFKETEE